MKLDWTPRPRALLVFLLSQLTLPGDGNEGSIVGSCLCDKIIPSGPRPEVKLMDHMRKYLKAYDRCPFYIRFHLHSRKVCGGSKEPWVQELVSCFEHKECGSVHWKKLIDQKHLPPPSTLTPKPTEVAPPDKSTLAQLWPTQQSTLPPGPLPSDNQFTLLSETTTPTSAYSVGAGPEAAGNHKQQGENRAATASSTSAVVPVLSLLAIIFILTGVLFFVLCKRKRKKSEKYSSDLQLQCTLVTPDPNTPEPQMEAYKSTD
ncbi:PREDICTED: C-X-C motif chemokine 16 [Dipodomys ordii]|uniref:C-X-C motif chemokine 16 n=1 Tax=Dipodomys ordii TaxID=10020 RepID=A0A1S3EVP5_DIPOR|nr:PREDICTED: C-X-C motif chemokine 16 [Dipodomys ordii]XP_012868490.1 PREDICTED: C-X-C motif chemokine 16 [Dipodomys ordii]XP_012868491.1 PREDICTED: C-X-C motif chemokine 16 [Dipodomys ordii]